MGTHRARTDRTAAAAFATAATLLAFQPGGGATAFLEAGRTRSADGFRAHEEGRQFARHRRADRARRDLVPGRGDRAACAVLCPRKLRAVHAVPRRAAMGVETARSAGSRAGHAARTSICCTCMSTWPVPSGRSFCDLMTGAMTPLKSGLAALRRYLRRASCTAIVRWAAHDRETHHRRPRDRGQGRRRSAVGVPVARHRRAVFLLARRARLGRRLPAMRGAGLCRARRSDRQDRDVLHDAGRRRPARLGRRSGSDAASAPG